MRGRAWILSLLSLCCCKADDGAKSRQPAPAVAVRETPNAAAASPDPENLPASSCERDIDFRLAGTPRERVGARFGPPAERESHRADDVGGEFYVAIEQTYPSSDPKNDVPIEEWTWRSGDCRLTVWFHKPKGTWEVLDDVFYDYRTQF